MKIKYVVDAVKWFDRINGNTYHSVTIIRTKDGDKLHCSFHYGYGDYYRSSALNALVDAEWLPKKYTRLNVYLYERENNYPIYWTCRNGTKQECIANGKAN